MERNRHSGLTMPKILVTVAAIAVLAAAGAPALTQHIGATATASTPELQQLQHAVNSFTTDVRHYPGDLQQLVTRIAATSGRGDSLNFDGAATPIQFTPADTLRWKGPYTQAAITTELTGGGRFTSSSPRFVVGRKIRLAGAWLTVPILAPTTCAELLALNKSFDDTPTSANNESVDGVVVWVGTCSSANSSGTVRNPVLRIAPAN